MIEFIQCMAISLMIGSLICSLLSVILVFNLSNYVKATDEVQQISMEQVKDQDVTDEQKAIDKEREEKVKAEKKAKKEAKERELERQARLTLAQNFKTCGVLHSKNYRFTWYSSKVLYHYRTPEWTTDDANIYRDKDGYVVIASYSHKMGTVIDTPFGEGKVYDKCGVAGTIDVYVNW